MLGSIPPSFVEEALTRCQKHAAELLCLLQEGQEQGGLLKAGLYGYCALTIGLMYRLYESHDDPAIASMAHMRVEQAVEFLGNHQQHQPVFNNMILSVQSFRPNVDVAKALINPVSLASKATIRDASTLWHLLDYARMPEISPSSPDDTGVMTGLLQEVIEQGESAGLEEGSGYFAAVDAASEGVYAQGAFVEGMAGGSLWPEQLPQQDTELEVAPQP
ncbi:hypothetical protein CLAFUW4_02428 [Fulvia fulva]|uniref:Uncharacterized protein n=1 Tax=Passalora fulva TaxID=5499 RepID=A0A9Q8L9S1_PASFU|nr:uncharacterized protein CLAFUR5_02418 [Fulvia fulva]KAK4631361.1 hypothetical protein CLAFUR4_02423 [Fulvia fulva]KAK4634006.1 hypothetical protein CLAFUR0_02427 [Fulvia fulva]UJO13535.1 hypothetical protein CLAFUR5_02418 [Fulvia fulva]WPV11605.1 hypothetical protein CLAFUW4_02428 [Fulvia fulva]WPV26470.1 hypothetical protein CLAFUW7_02428 [Fulvia fulva]